MPVPATILARNNVRILGSGTQPMLFAHGFGCDQTMWRFVAPAFADTHRVIRFDHIGCGGSDASAYDDARHATLDGYASDVVDILEALDLRDVVFVGHSVSAQIGLLASLRVPERFDRLVLIGPSPRYLNDPPDYVGGFERADIDGLIDMIDRNLLGFANFLAPAAMGAQNPAELTAELRDSICAADPYITRRFALATFLGDDRDKLPAVRVPALVIQCRDDSIAPMQVGEYVHRRLAGSMLRVLDASGHCPHLSHPAETVALIRDYLATARP
jgi:sigma-B regulation protein RsbQ